MYKKYIMYILILKLKYSNMTKTYHISTMDCQKQMAVKSGDTPLKIRHFKTTFHSCYSNATI